MARIRGWQRWLIVGVAVVAILAVAGPYVYIHFIEGKAPKKLTLSQNTTPTNAGSSAANQPLDGAWKVGAGSQAGYRVKEILFGQNHEAVGRTTAVTGNATITGTKVTAADVTVDLTQVSSDQARRDNQFHHRIMDTSTFPMATFKLTQPIDLPSTNGRVSVKATGDLTAHAVTKSAVADLQAERSGTGIRVSG
ncbi:MAG TPA: YceI family protein, partial [Mycobacteriales bacterium]|nr:YceI family protein [Mycobacteriales bacterium]